MSEMLPDVVAVIPARGGSRGVPGKNVALVQGVSLVARAVRAALRAGIDSVAVSTDDERIAQVARAAGARVIDRPAELAGDTASSESALLHSLETLEREGSSPSVLAFLQATSPFIDADALARAVERVRTGADDVVFSACETHVFLWRHGEFGAEAVDHDAARRERRQDREPRFQETGAFYVMRVDGFRQVGHRFFGRIGIEQVEPASAIDVDTPADLDRARAVAHLLAPRIDEPIEVDGLVMDFDGVHTDDRVVVDSSGVEAITASRSDGAGLSRLRDAGLPMLILSQERDLVVAARGRKLGIEVRQGIDDKLTVLRSWAAENGLDLARIAYVGNDLGDEACLRHVGWPVVVPDAHPSLLPIARVVLTRPGGHGALRELADRILSTRKETP